MSIRVLHVNSELAWRGGERQIELLAKYSAPLVKSIIACHPEGKLYQRISENHEVFDLPIRNSFELHSALCLKKLARNVDLIHCHTPKAQSIAVLAKMLGCKTPVVCTKRTSFPIGDNFFSRFKYRKTDQLVCVSQASANVLRKQTSDLNLKVIHSAIEKSDHVDPVDLSQPIPETKGRKVIGYVAAVTDEKNRQTFINTANSIIRKNDDCCFLWIGDGALKEEVRAQLDLLNLSDRIFLTGFQKDIQSWIASLDVLFFPSLSEGFPTTLIQAMQLSVPVIASDLPGIREIVTDGETGLLCEAKDEDGFANMIQEILSNGDLRNTLTSNALNSVEQYYADQMAEKYINLYQEVLDRTISK